MECNLKNGIIYGANHPKLIKLMYHFNKEGVYMLSVGKWGKPRSFQLYSFLSQLSAVKWGQGIIFSWPLFY